MQRILESLEAHVTNVTSCNLMLDDLPHLPSVRLAKLMQDLPLTSNAKNNLPTKQ